MMSKTAIGKSCEEANLDQNVASSFLNWIPYYHSLARARVVLQFYFGQPAGSAPDPIDSPPDGLESLELGDRLEQLWCQNETISLFVVLLRIILRDLIKSICLFIFTKIVLVLFILQSTRRLLELLEATVSSKPEALNAQQISANTSDVSSDQLNPNNSEDFHQIISICAFILSLTLHSLFANLLKFTNSKISLKCRVAISEIIIRKSLQLQSRSSHQARELLSLGVGLIETGSGQLTLIPMAPLVCLSLNAYLSVFVEAGGWFPICMGFISTIFMLLVGGCLANISARITIQRRPETQDKASLICDTLNRIRYIKLYNLEEFINRSINRLRGNEMGCYRKLDNLLVFDSFSRTFFTRFSPAVIFLAYIWLKIDINLSNLIIVAMVFASFNYYSLNKFPKALKSVVDMKRACESVESYLNLEPEYDDYFNNIYRKCRPSHSYTGQCNYEQLEFVDEIKIKSQFNQTKPKYINHYSKTRKPPSMSTLIRESVSISSLITTTMLAVAFSLSASVADFSLTRWFGNIVAFRGQNNYLEMLMSNWMAYCILSVACGIILLLSLLKVLFVCRRISLELHKRLVYSLLSSKMSFYDNPDNILNDPTSNRMRLVEFIQLDHELMPIVVNNFFNLTSFLTLTVILARIKLMLASANLATTLLLGLATNRKYRQITQLMRLQRKLVDSIESSLSSTIHNYEWLSAHKLDENYVKYLRGRFSNCQDKLTSVSSLLLDYRAYASLFSILTMTLLTGFIMLQVLSSEDLKLDIAIYLMACLTNSIVFPRLLSDFWEMFATIKMAMEPMRELLFLEPEEPEELEERQAFKNAPVWGRIDFKQVSLNCTTASGPLRLRDLSLTIEAGYKVALVGDEKYGKSAIVDVLFKLYDFEGSIEIDGTNLKQISVGELRRNVLGFISREPMLFNDTLRKNLDPYGEFNDGQLWRVLDMIQIRQHVTQNSPIGLDYQIDDNGRNFNVNQRQLICLARAILKTPKILIMEEATANVDQDTDILIQRTIRKHLTSTTIITITDRLSTILDYDRVLVLQSGHLLEYDNVDSLLGKQDSLFRNLLTSDGESLKFKIYSYLP